MSALDARCRSRARAVSVDQRGDTRAHFGAEMVVLGRNDHELPHARGVAGQCVTGGVASARWLGSRATFSSSARSARACSAISAKRTDVLGALARKRLHVVVAGRHRDQQVAVDGAGQHRAVARPFGLFQQQPRDNGDSGGNRDRDAADKPDLVADAHGAPPVTSPLAGDSRPRSGRSVPSAAGHPYRPWQCLYFLPEPHGQASLRPTLPQLSGSSGLRSATCTIPLPLPSSAGTSAASA